MLDFPLENIEFPRKEKLGEHADFCSSLAFPFKANILRGHNQEEQIRGTFTRDKYLTFLVEKNFGKQMF
jgi:hypothetical protein